MIEFLATEAHGRLVFRETDGSDGTGPLLDNISFKATGASISPPPPLPPLPPQTSGNLVTNGSFESNTVHDKGWKTFHDSQVPGWTSLNGQPLELWDSYHNHIPAPDGHTLMEIDYAGGHVIDGIYQVCVWTVPSFYCQIHDWYFCQHSQFFQILVQFLVAVFDQRLCDLFIHQVRRIPHIGKDEIGFIAFYRFVVV